MKHRTIAIVSVATLLLALMVWSFGSSAAAINGDPTANNSIEASESVPQQAQEDESVDADLGKFGSKIDRDEYLRLRGEYIGRKRGIEPGRPFDPSLRTRALDQMDRQEKGRRLESLVNGDLAASIGTDAGGAWTSLGPTSITNGQPLSGGDAAVSGRVTSIAVDPTNSNNVYLGTAQGGVWRSTDGGTTWAAIFDSADSLAIGALAVAPSDPSKLYVGTGEFNGCADCFFGVGLYRIDNVNSSPTLVGPINPPVTVSNFTYPVFNGRGITKIVVDPTNAANIFVSTGRGVGGSGASSLGLVGGAPSLATRGLYRSTNATGGAGSVAFQKLVVTTDGSPDSPATGNVDTTDIVMEPGNPNNLLVAVIGFSATFGGVYRTTNALAATPAFSQVYAAATSVRTSLAINKVGSVVTAYAATSETPNNTPSCTTQDSGAVRKQVDPFNVSSGWATQLTGGGGFCGGQCFYDMAIAVNPNDASEVYLGGNARGTCSDGMKKSTDGGATFSRDDTGLHADSHSLVFDGVGNIYTGNDGGVWKRSTCTQTGSAWTNLNATLNTLQFESIAVHPSDRNLMIGGTQDNGTQYQQSSAGNWRNAEGGDGGYSLIDQSATDTTNVIMYHTFFNVRNDQVGFDRAVTTTCLPNKNFWPTRGSGFLTGADAEQTSLSCDGTADYLHNGLSVTDNMLFYAPMALGPGSPNTLYFGTDRLYRSTDKGDTMTVVSQASLSTPGSIGSPISSIAIWSGGDNVRLVGLQNGQVWATSTGSSTMVNLAPSFPPNPNGSANKFVGRVAIDPNNQNVGYAALSYFAPAGQGIWKITNLAAAAGASPAPPQWAAAGNGIPSIPINALVIDPSNSSDLYAGTDIGVYNSTDGGAHWAPFGSGLPRASVFDLALQNANRILRAATHGRGVWEVSLNGAPPIAPPPPTPPSRTTNPIDTADLFVRQQYADFLNRVPDSSGLGFWTNEIVSCRCDQGCIDTKRINVSAAFYLSIEFQETGYLVERMYKSAYGDFQGTSTFNGTHPLSVPIVRFGEFLPDTQTIGQGVQVGIGNWQAQLEANKQSFASAFVQRTRFTNAFATTLPPSQFVDALFANAGITPSTTERNTAVSRFGGATNTTDVAARGRALRDVAENPTLSTNEFNKAFVLMQYFGYLRRNPNDAPESGLNYTGYDFWLTKLNQFNGNFGNADMVKAFILSAEYRQRFGI
jgi:hypothetical protein